MSKTRPQHRHDFRPKLIALSVAACFSLSSGQSQANPTGGSVTSGSASFAVSGNTLTITNSASAIINWASFSIGVNEITQFLQSSGASAVLNRVVGLNGVIPQSVIDGVLSSNGRVFLLNQSGILIGSTARIDVAGFVASSLNLSDQDFLNGRMNFTETPGAGAVSNAGIINTSSGGRVFLVAPDVQNSGIIRSPQGEIVLAAGKSVELISEGSPFVTVNITADSERALNVGQLISDSGHIGMFGALVRQSGVIDANSAVAGANGEIRLVATKDLTLDAGSLTTANGPSGGNVLLQAQGGTNLIAGTVEAKGSAGQGGTVEALGVRVGVIGSGVIDASGDAGGGTVLVGGDAHGANPNVQNADRTFIGSDGVIRADAGTTGDGGRVIVWADGDTRFYGSISARGGSQSGNGGFVETSGELGLDIQGGRIDLRAPGGQWGTWLLDPTDVTIIYGTAGQPGTDPAVSGAAPGVDIFGANPVNGGTVTSGTLEANFLNVGTTRIQATNDVNFRSNLNLVYGGATPQTFEVRAQHNIDLANDGTAHTITTNGQDVVLSANDVGPYATTPTLNTAFGNGSIIGGGNIVTNSGGGVGGNITLSGYGVSVGNLQTAGGLDTRIQALRGNVIVTALYGGVQTGNITTHGVDGSDFFAGQGLSPTAGANGGNITISAAYGSATTGTIDAGGGNGGNGGYGIGDIQGASGGSGGIVVIGDATTTSITTGAIVANGGAGGYGGSGGLAAATAATFQVGYGGNGGGGGTVIFTSAGNVTTGAVTLSGGAGGAGGSNIYATLTGLPVGVDVQGTVDVGRGGTGGNGGSLVITGNDISTGAIVATGGAGGAGGAGNTATANVGATSGAALGQASSGAGGSGGSGGAVQFNAFGNVNVAGITLGGGGGGAGGSGGSATVNASSSNGTVNAFAESGFGGSGNFGGSIFITSSGTYGNITIGDISSPGGAGGAAGNNSASTSAISSSTAYGVNATSNIGNGGSAGSGASVNITGGTYGAVTIGAISTNGGAGGAANSGGSAQAYASSPFVSGFAVVNLGSGGSGGGGGFVGISGDTVSTLAINTSSGSGADGAGAASASATGSGPVITTLIFAGNGGFSGFSGGGVSLVGGTSVSTGPITSRGGNGGNGGATTLAGGFGGSGGDGAEGGSISLTAPVSVTVAGAIDATGGQGGAGGSSTAGYGGNGGAGGNNSFVIISIDPDIASVGSISAAGGAGGNGGNGGIQGGNGGAGGAGAYVAFSSLTYGALTVGNIDVSGASGGAGGLSGGAAFYGGAGGNGGYGGFAFVFGGSIDMLSGGTILANGRSGGAGGAAASAGYGGNGGIGGGGGTIELIATPDALGTPGSIQVAGTLNTDVTGGPGGAGGAGGGLAGTSGPIGTVAIFGDLSQSTPSTDSGSGDLKLEANTLTETTNSLLPADTTPTVEAIEKKKKEKKEAAVCR